MPTFLDARKAREIRERYEAGRRDPLRRVTYAQLAREYGVNVAAIVDVILGRTWADAGGPIRTSQKEPRDFDGFDVGRLWQDGRLPWEA